MNNKTVDKALPWAILFVIGLVVGILFKLPPEYTTAAKKVFLSGPLVWAVVGFFVGIGYWFWLTRHARKTAKQMRISVEAVWRPLENPQFSYPFENYIKENSESTKALGYIPVGAHFVKELPIGQIQSVSHLHPSGQSVVHITRIATTFALEIQSFLDDGSIVESSNVDDSVTMIQKKLKATRADAKTYLAFHPELNTDILYAEFAQHGFLVHLYPGVTIEELIAAHNRSVQTILEDPSVGLRSLSVENWRQYALYASGQYDQIKFDLGKFDNAPVTFPFPSGEISEADRSRLTSAEPVQVV